MFHTPAHKQTNPALLPAQIVNRVGQFFYREVEGRNVKCRGIPGAPFIAWIPNSKGTLIATRIEA
jgi:hypothetical protein